MTRSWISTILLTLGGLVVCAFLAAAVVPSFVAWDDYRHEIEADLSSLMGSQVRIEGNINVRLIPSPVLDLGQVSLGGIGERGSETDAVFTSEHLTVLLDPAQLLDFEFVADQVTLEAPKLRAVRYEDGSLAVEGLSIPTHKDSLSQRIQIGNLAINDGEINVFDQVLGETYRIQSIHGDASLASLNGPYAFEGSGQWQGERFNIGLDIGTIKEGEARSTVRITSGSYPIVLTMRGLANFGEMTFQGNLSAHWYRVSDDLLNNRDLSPLWEVTSPFLMNQSSLTLDGLAVQFDQHYQNARLRGFFSLDWQGANLYQLDLGADHVKLADQNEGLSLVQWRSDLADFVNHFISVWPKSWRGNIDVRLPSVEMSGAILQNNQLSVAQTKGGWVLDTLKLALPGEADLVLSLDAFGPDVKTLSGHMSFNAGDTATAFSALFGLNEDQTDHLGRFVPSSITGSFGWDKGNWIFSETALLIGDSQFKGVIEYGVQGDTIGLHLAGTSSRLDVDTLLNLRDEVRVLTDGTITGIPTRLSLALGVDQVSYKRLFFQDVNIQGQLDAQKLVVNGFEVADFHGLKVSGLGRLSLNSSQPTGHLKLGLAGESPELFDVLTNSYPEARSLLGYADIAKAISSDTDINLEFDMRTGVSDVAITTQFNGTIGKTAFGLDGRYYAPMASFVLSPFRQGQVSVEYDITQSSAEGLFSSLLNLSSDNNTFPLSWKGSLNGELGQDFTVSQLLQLGDGFINFEGQLFDVWHFEDAQLFAIPSFNGLVTLEAFDTHLLSNIIMLNSLSLDGLGKIEGQANVTHTNESLALDQLHVSLGGEIWQGNLTFDKSKAWQLQGALATAKLKLSDLIGWFGHSELVNARGAWLENPFGFPNMPSFAFDVEVKADELIFFDEISGRSALVDLDYREPELTATLKSVGLSSGEVQGALVMRAIDQGGIALTAKATMVGVNSEDFVWRWHSRPVIEGELDASMIVSGQGISPAGLAASLNGSAHISLQPGTIRGLSDKVIDEVVRVRQLKSTFGGDALENLVQQHLDTGALDFRQIKGDFSIEAGLARSQNIHISGLPMQVNVNALVDLGQSKLDSAWLLNFEDNTVSSPPQIGLIFSGALSDPERRIDIAPLEAYLNLRAFEKNVDQLIELDSEGTSEP